MSVVGLLVIKPMSQMGHGTNPLSREGWWRGRAYCVYRSNHLIERG